MRSIKRLVAITILAFLLLGTGIALAGYDQAGAKVRMAQLAHWKAACGQGYWRCKGFVIQGPYGPAHGDPEWRGTVILFRHRKGSPSWQTCHVEVGLNHDETTEELIIDCEYALS